MRVLSFYLFFLTVSCSQSNYSVHENNLSVGNKIMIKHDKKIEELNSARECPRFYLPTLERYGI